MSATIFVVYCNLRYSWLSPDWTIFIFKKITSIVLPRSHTIGIFESSPNSEKGHWYATAMFGETVILSATIKVSNCGVWNFRNRNIERFLHFWIPRLFRDIKLCLGQLLHGSMKISNFKRSDHYIHFINATHLLLLLLLLPKLFFYKSIGTKGQSATGNELAWGYCDIIHMSVVLSTILFI